MLPDNETRHEELTPKEQISSEESVDTSSDILADDQKDSGTTVHNLSDTATKEQEEQEEISDIVREDNADEVKEEQEEGTEEPQSDNQPIEEDKGEDNNAQEVQEVNSEVQEVNSQEETKEEQEVNPQEVKEEDTDSVQAVEDKDNTIQADGQEDKEQADGQEDAQDEEEQEEDSEEQTDDTQQEPMVELADLDEYREGIPQDEQTALVDVNEFLEMKKKSEAYKKDSKKKKKKGDDIFANRYKAKTINAAVAAAQPITYFYNAVLDKVGQIIFFNVYQVLQDRFMGKLIPQQYTAVAEGSAKIEELNIANVIEQVKICNEYPKYGFVVSVSTRFFTRPNILEKLCKELKTDNNNLILAFDCVSLQNIGTAAKTGLSILRIRGAKIMLDNTEQVSMATLSDLEYDYIRIDARYYEKGAERPLAYLELLSRFAASQGIVTSATFCDEAYLAEYMLSRGITGVQGDAISRPMRTVPNAVKAVTKIPSMIVD